MAKRIKEPKFKPIQLNPDIETRQKIEKAAQIEHRFVGPMALEIIRRYFASQESAKDATQS